MRKIEKFSLKQFDCGIFLIVKSLSKRFFLYLIIIVTSFLLVGVALLCFSLLKESIFAFLPIPFCAVAFFTFQFPKDPVNNTVGLVLANVLRFLSVLLAILIPVLIWKFVQEFQAISPAWIFLSAGETLVTYISAIIYTYIDAKKEDGEVK